MKRLALAVVIAFLLGVGATTVLLSKGELPHFNSYFGGTLVQRISTLESWARQFSRDAEKTLVENWNWTGDLAARYSALEARISRIEERISHLEGRSSSDGSSGSGPQQSTAGTGGPGTNGNSPSNGSPQTSTGSTPANTASCGVHDGQQRLVGDTWGFGDWRPSNSQSYGSDPNVYTTHAVRDGKQCVYNSGWSEPRVNSYFDRQPVTCRREAPGQPWICDPPLN